MAGEGGSAGQLRPDAMLRASSMARFSSALAKVLFVEPGDIPGAVSPTSPERMLVRKLAQRIEEGDERTRHAMCHLIEKSVLSVLSAESMVELACVIERLAPWMIDNIPGLAARRARLRRAADMAAAFGPEHLERLASALREETSRQ